MKKDTVNSNAMLTVDIENLYASRNDIISLVFCVLLFSMFVGNVDYRPFTKIDHRKLSKHGFLGPQTCPWLKIVTNFFFLGGATNS